MYRMADVPNKISHNLITLKSFEKGRKKGKKIENRDEKEEISYQLIFCQLLPLACWSIDFVANLLQDQELFLVLG
jgi:hypothetical protein